MILSVDYSESKFFLFERNEFLDVVFVRRTYIYIYIYIEMDWTDWSQFISLKLVLPKWKGRISFSLKEIRFLLGQWKMIDGRV